MKKNTVSAKNNTGSAKKPAAAKSRGIGKDPKISPVKAAQIRKAAMKLDPQFTQVYEALKNTDKDIDNAKETVKNKLDSLSEMGEMESLRLQMAMDRLSKLMSTLSNLLKKASETASAIIQNMK
jgi:hypothetical protein